ncbi:unnamed protein product [Moneuplotes crassus]|uniref:Phospholipase/carboxylesterase/thioesterase domain-containing protein n=1 Tax=Euplotes crassus TaxID=5936 RepID=A0AAD1XEI9_EUPCR|nr:unnamed protein product [Moneuplotes crassus]
MSITRDSHDNLVVLSKLKANYTLIWLHGLGDDEFGFTDVFTSHFSPLTDRTRVVLLNAPERKCKIAFGQEVSCWFDITGFNFLRDKTQINFDHVNEQKDLIIEVIEREVENLGGDPSSVFIGGFSQGAALAFYTACEYEKVLGGCIMLSGHSLYDDPETQIPESKKELPIFAYHGKFDMKLPYKASFWYAERLSELGFNIEFHTASKMGHTVEEEELEVLTEFMTKIAPEKET